jgi:urea transport system ATP-binding protein
MVLEINDVNQFYGESHTLWDLDLTIETGSRTCLMGRNGVGKSTLLRCIMGLERIKSGCIRYNGEALENKGPQARAPAGIAYVPQGREIFPRLTIDENLRTGLGVTGAARVPEMIFELFPVLAQMLHRRGGDLSGGQQQQLAIGRALVLEPTLLILDEPTEGIQPNIVREIGDIITRLNETLGLTVLLVEQKLPFARRVGDHFAMMDKGRRVATGTIDELNDDIVRRHLSV